MLFRRQIVTRKERRTHHDARKRIAEVVRDDADHLLGEDRAIFLLGMKAFAFAHELLEALPRLNELSFIGVTIAGDVRREIVHDDSVLLVANHVPDHGQGPAVGRADLELHLGNNGPQLRLRENCDPDREDCRDRGDYRRDYERRSDRRECTPDRALDKADRMGIRRARIDDVGRRTISVRGRNRDGDRVVVTFARQDRRCPVLASDY